MMRYIYKLLHYIDIELDCKYGWFCHLVEKAMKRAHIKCRNCYWYNGRDELASDHYLQLCEKHHDIYMNGN